MIQIPINEIYLALLAVARVTALFFIMPVFSMSVFPRIAKVGLAGIIAVLVVPTIQSTPVIPSTLIGLVVAFVGEILIGMLMGYGGRMLFFAVEVAADLMAREAALMRAQAFDPTTETQGSVLTPLYFFLTVAVFLVSGTHLEVISAFVVSYDYVPAGLGAFSMSGMETITRSFGMIFELGLRMAAPLMALTFVVNVLFAILGKVAAKVNVLILSFGIRILLALWLLAMSVGLILRFVIEGLDGTGLKMLEFIVAN